MIDINERFIVKETVYCMPYHELDDIAVLTKFMPIYSYKQGHSTFYVLDKENL